MKTFSKALAGTAAAGAMALASATPAQAQRYHDDDDGIGAGEIIAGAVILGGIAAIASSIGGRDRYDDRYRDRYNHRDNYNRGSARQAVDRCVRAATQDANRYTYGRAQVTQIRDVDRRRDGYRVKGNLVVAEGNRYGGRYDRYNYRGRDRDRYDNGRFTCEIRYGRISDMDYSGIRGLG